MIHPFSTLRRQKENVKTMGFVGSSQLQHVISVYLMKLQISIKIQLDRKEQEPDGLDKAKKKEFTINNPEKDNEYSFAYGPDGYKYTQVREDLSNLLFSSKFLEDPNKQPTGHNPNPSKKALK